MRLLCLEAWIGQVPGLSVWMEFLVCPKVVEVLDVGPSWNRNESAKWVDPMLCKGKKDDCYGMTEPNVIGEMNMP